jgi:malate dehydrogenase
MKPKVTIVGCGSVGSAAAQWLAKKDICDMVLIDIVEGLPQGLALDLQQAAPIENFDAKLTGTNDYEDTKDSDIVVVTAGFPRTPDMTREDLLERNAVIVKDIVKNVVKTSPESILIMVTNPLDVMTYLALKTSRFPKNRVMGQSGILDSARMSHFIAEELNVSPSKVQSMVLGGHSNTMVPLPRFSTIDGRPATELLTEEQVKRVIERTRKGGLQILKLLRTGSTRFAPGAAIARMVEAILKDTKEVMPCSAYLEGAYGLSNLCFGVPVKLGKGGVEEIIELELTEQEEQLLKKSARLVRENIEKLGI